MGFPTIFGLARVAAIVGPRSVLPSACTTTTVISISATTSINNSTLTYTGPFNDGFFFPFTFTTTTYTTIIPTRGADGVIDSQTYTIIGIPVETPISLPTVVTPVVASVPDPFPVSSTPVSHGSTAAIQSQLIELPPTSSIMSGLPSHSPGSQVY